MIDGDIDDHEILACKNIFIQFGYKPVIFEILLKTIVESIKMDFFKEAIIQSFMQKYFNLIVLWQELLP